MKYLKKFNEMLDPMGSWNPSQLDNKEDDYDGVPSRYDEDGEIIEDDSDVCPKCDCIPCQCTGEECKECGCFPCECNEDIKENKVHKEGTFAYYNAMTPEKLRSLEKSFKHDFENPAQHDPKFVAYLKACELKKVFSGKDHTPRNLKKNKLY